ncbi:hypothetical protein [Miltoncostaea marina]|uniref:hypothetical protein n=1 Tax=Miltoncostaea marina TaxID=2843215 RepID=UPI001C3E0255|nr:hypothetical protein [Miltoncostaea marina]
MLLAVAALTAVAAGLTGTWSPCGLSMVDSLADEPRRARAALARLAFAAGALTGGAVTFGGLALAGAALRGEDAALAAAAGVAALAAVVEAAGVGVVPRIRRQVPEHWRRTMPLAVAAALYGGLLGLGFTTFVMTWAVWALAAVCLLLGSPLAGLVVGMAFGAGRAAPVALMSARRDGLGGEVMARMIAGPRLLRRARRIDALLLAALALAAAAGAAL